MMRSINLLLLLPLFVSSLVGAGLSHEVGLSATIQVQTASGEVVTYTADDLPVGAQIRAIAIVGVYSTGEPMAGAAVEIYAPGEPTTPWRSGTLDQQGRYTFTPDPANRGRWTIRVEAAGHRSFINVVI